MRPYDNDESMMDELDTDGPVILTTVEYDVPYVDDSALEEMFFLDDNPFFGD